MRNQHAFLMFVFALTGAGLLAFMATKAYDWDFMTAFFGFLVVILAFMYVVFRHHYLKP